MQTNSTVYNIPLALEIRGQLNKDKLGSAIDKLLKNNRVLQSYFILDDNEIYSKINKHVFIKKISKNLNIKNWKQISKNLLNHFN